MSWLSLYMTDARWVSSTEEGMSASEQPTEVEMSENSLIKQHQMKSGLDNANKRLDYRQLIPLSLPELVVE